MTINLLAVIAGVLCISIGSSNIRTSVGDWDLFLACLWMSAGIVLIRIGINTNDPE
jgi:hypothetical protein